mgnify:FL=1
MTADYLINVIWNWIKPNQTKPFSNFGTYVELSLLDKALGHGFMVELLSIANIKTWWCDYGDTRSCTAHNY